MSVTAKTRLSQFIEYLQEVDSNHDIPDDLGGIALLKVMERFSIGPEGAAIKVLAPSVYAWQRVWNRCAELGMDIKSKQDSATVVLNFIEGLCVDRVAAEAKKTLAEPRCSSADQRISPLE